MKKIKPEEEEAPRELTNLIQTSHVFSFVSCSAAVNQERAYLFIGPAIPVSPHRGSFRLIRQLPKNRGAEDLEARRFFPHRGMLQWGLITN